MQENFSCAVISFRIQAGDPWIAAYTIMTLAALASAAGMIPAQRASRVDPIQALRFE